ncbi:hypothetical protein AXE85_07100 [Gemella sp. oral taxon 928]|uniref:low temperature requirement protein A n=1 Tax=Gemella sp. oral taxon 928 TaxID=1785995 RepID=UPI0007683CD4|nr:low temperature requirement protein A [Gemella sp. oral taxon 928]AME09927.1 hypothetical protein AXE85_07100 [Gemella sp. oral taxon 928]
MNNSLNKTLKKEISITELLYDFIFSFAFCNIFNIILGSYNSSLGFNFFLSFLFIFIIFVNTWNIEMIHINRYGKNSLFNIVFMIIQICILIITLNNIDTYHWTILYRNLILYLTILSFILSVQHTVQYFIVTDLIEKKITEPFIYILSGRTFSLFLGIILPQPYSLLFIMISFFTSWLLPSFISRSLHAKTIIFSHVVKRCFIFTTGLFSSIIINNFITTEQKNWFIIFVIIALLYLFYQINIERFIDFFLINQSGNSYLYHNYFIILGLCIINFTLPKLTENKLFLLFIMGVFFFLVGNLLQNQYNKKGCKYSKYFFVTIFLIFLLGSLLSMILNYSLIVILLTIIFILLSYFIFNIKRTNPKL